jgi:23S rRNA (guanosine2251-2'-O)-methyltransferase
MSEESIVFGLHAVRTLLQQRPERAALVLLQKGREDARATEILKLAQAAGVRTEWRDSRELDRLAGDDRHQGACVQMRSVGVLGEGALDEILDRFSGAPLLLVLDGVQDPHNLGACLRTADAAGASAVIVPRDRAVGLTPTVRKERSIWIIGADDQAPKSVYETALDVPVALVLGAEGAGLRRLTRENCDALIRIPMSGVVESLNVSVATGVVLFEAVRQRQK